MNERPHNGAPDDARDTASIGNPYDVLPEIVEIGSMSHPRPVLTWGSADPAAEARERVARGHPSAQHYARYGRRRRSRMRRAAAVVLLVLVGIALGVMVAGMR